MSRSVLIELQLPKDWRRFRLPKALQDRLQALLDQQEETGHLSRAEKGEAEALVDLADLLSLLKLRARLSTRRKRA